MATLILVPLIGCSDDDDSPMGTGSGNSSGCDGITSTGTNSAGHVHTVCVPDSDLSNPPAGGGTYPTSSDAGHTHSITLTQAQLQAIAGGGSVTVTSTGPNHTHDFLVEMSG
jgi:hypothetical protein